MISPIRRYRWSRSARVDSRIRVGIISHSAMCTHEENDARHNHGNGLPSKCLKRLLCDRGQATVEYLVIGLVVMIVAVALACLWHLASDGTFVQHASSSASHVVDSVDLGVIGDVFMY